MARRYVIGETREAALARTEQLGAGGHRVTIDHLGESVRDTDEANAATEEFLRLIDAIATRRLDAGVSLDLSHIGTLVDTSLGRRNLDRLAEATAAAGCELIISMEGPDRTADILAEHARIAGRHRHVGIRVQARLRRTPADLRRLLDLPGRICLVKGAYDTSEELAVRREDPALGAIYDGLADTLLRSGHPGSIATHDPARIAHATATIRDEHLEAHPYLFEMLMAWPPALSTPCARPDIPHRSTWCTASSGGSTCATGWPNSPTASSPP